MNYRNERIFVVFTTILAVIFVILMSFTGITPFQGYLIGTITGCGIGIMWAFHLN